MTGPFKFEQKDEFNLHHIKIRRRSSPLTSSIQVRPLLSIGMPVYNEERHLAQTLDSLLAQDYENFELILADNASVDATPQICADYSARDARIRYHRNETNIGGMRNFNRAFELAKGDYFMWASGHDRRHPTMISRCMEVLTQDTSVVLCYPQTIWVDDEGQPLEIVHDYIDTRGLLKATTRLNAVLWGLVTGFPIYGVIKSDALRQTRLFARVVSPDIALLGELSLLGTFAYIPEPLLYALKPEDHGNWEVYVAKHFTRGLSGWSAQMLFWRMNWDLIRRVMKHIPGYGGKVTGLLSVLLCMLSKYRWMLVGLRSLKRKS